MPSALPAAPILALIAAIPAAPVAPAIPAAPVARAAPAALAADSARPAQTLPLYVGKPVIGDYRCNQALLGAIRWTSLGLVLGGMASALYPEDQLGIMAAFGIAAGGALGFAAGTTAGYLRGRDWGTSLF